MARKQPGSPNDPNIFQQHKVGVRRAFALGAIGLAGLGATTAISAGETARGDRSNPTTTGAPWPDGQPITRPVNKGDTYWEFSQQELGADNQPVTDKAIADKAAEMEVVNPGADPSELQVGSRVNMPPRVKGPGPIQGEAIDLRPQQ